MDGIKFVIPNSCKAEVDEKKDLLEEIHTSIIPCPGCDSGNHSLHNGIYAKTYDWSGKNSIVFRSFIDPKFRRKK
jgi:hypothetical protein